MGYFLGIFGFILLLVWIVWYFYARFVKKQRLTGLPKYLGWIGLALWIVGMIISPSSSDSSKQATKSSSQQTSKKSEKSNSASSDKKSSSSSSNKLTDKQMESKINDALNKGLEEEHANDPDGWGKYIGKMQYLNGSQGLEGVNIYLNAQGMELSKAQGYEVAKRAKNAADGYLSTINVNDTEQKQIFKYLDMDPSDGKTTTQAHLVTRDGDSIASTSPLRNNQFKEKDFMK